MGRPFESSRQHLYAELARLDLTIQREVWRWRQANPPDPQAGDEFHGLYVSDVEVDAIVRGVHPGSARIAREAAGRDVDVSFGEAIRRARSEIARRKAVSVEHGTSLRLERLRALFHLTPFDVDALLICVATEVDLRYERLYAYLQDDVTRKRPSVSLILNLLCATQDEKLAARDCFWADGPLLRHRLIALLADPAVPHPPLLARYAKPDPRIVEYLLSEDEQDAAEPKDRTGRGEIADDRLRGFCHIEHPCLDLDALRLLPSTKTELVRLATKPPNHRESSSLLDRTTMERVSDLEPPDAPSPLLVFLQGDRGTGKRRAAQAVCAVWQRPLLTAHLPRALAGQRRLADSVRLVVREAHLGGAALYWDGYDSLADRDAERHAQQSWTQAAQQTLHRQALYAALLEYPVTSFLPIEDVEREADRTLLHAPRLVRIRFSRPAYALRQDQWSDALASTNLSPGVDIPAVAGRFRLTAGQIAEAALDAHHRAVQRGPAGEEITGEDLFAAARARTSDQLHGRASKIEPRHDWRDLVLPDDQVTHLHELCDQMKHRHIVLGEWGFDRKLSMGKGLNALFAGPSGTGKTMAAEVIARDVGLDLYKIDLSTVVSKYVGETEKNLERIFGTARNSNAILFFDEADALFGKRSEVRDAHDRYANVEISYLLQKMEEYDGLVILTSNLSQNMDEAFVRRMHFTVEFPYPEEDARRRIWAIVFPEEAPLTRDVDLDLLADRYRLTGGNIRNVALTAAFLAARDGGVIGMDHLLWATRREYQKMGRLVDEREFALE